MGYLRILLITDPLIILATIIMGTASFAASLFDSEGRTQHKLATIWSRMLLFLAGVRMDVTGTEKLDPKGSYVIVSNHLSLMDTPVVTAHIPLQFRFFAKKGLFRIPFMGGHLRRAGHLPVVRDDPRASMKSLTDGARLIKERNISVLLFPEGGRSEGGLQPFKEGAALLAIKAGVPIVPVGLTGTREVLPMGSIQVRSGFVRLRVGDPIPTTDLKVQDRRELTNRLRDAVAELSGMAMASAADE